MEESPFQQQPQRAQQTFSNHYRRLQEIEQKVVRAVEAASFVMMELSKTREEADKQLLHAAATAFVTQIQEAQQLVLQAVKSAAPERRFEGNNYFAMVQAMVAAEKLDAVSVHVSGISKLLRQQRQQPDAPFSAVQLPGTTAGSSRGGSAGAAVAASDDTSHSEGDVGLVVVEEEPDTSAEDVMLVDGLDQSLGLLAPPADDQ